MVTMMRIMGCCIQWVLLFLTGSLSSQYFWKAYWSPFINLKVKNTFIINSIALLFTKTSKVFLILSISSLYHLLDTKI